MLNRLMVVAVAAVFFSTSAYSVPFDTIRIGDVDGFGYIPTTGFVRAGVADDPADTNGNNLIEQTEFLPDIDNDNIVATGRGDDFDFRSAAEIGGSFLTGSGFVDTGSTGSEFTDISLSTSYDTSQTNGNVLVGTSPNTFGAGGAFPGDGDPDTLSNQPGFEFRFDVAKGDLASGTQIFFNLIFGDFDVVPAQVDLTLNNGSGMAGVTNTLALTTQGGGQDGLVQAAFVTLDFGDVFSDGGTVWNGFLDVDFVAPNEPYTAFDFVELSVEQISLTPISAPEPPTLAILGFGIAALGFARRRRRAA